MFQQEVEAQIDRGRHASGRRHQAVLDDPLVDDLCGPAQFVHRAPMRRRLASGEETRGHQDQGAGADASHGLLRPEVQKGLQPIGVLDDLFPSLPPGTITKSRSERSRRTSCARNFMPRAPVICSFKARKRTVRSSGGCSCFALARTSYTPTASSSSTPSNTKIPMRTGTTVDLLGLNRSRLIPPG